jgi:hypothetical protein
MSPARIMLNGVTMTVLLTLRDSSAIFLASEPSSKKRSGMVVLNYVSKKVRSAGIAVGFKMTHAAARMV